MAFHLLRVWKDLEVPGYWTVQGSGNEDAQLVVMESLISLLWSGAQAHG